MFELYQLMKPFHPEKMSLITFQYMQQGIYNYVHFAHKGNATKQEVMRTAWPKALARLEGHFKTKDYRQWEWGKFHIDANHHVPFKNSAILSFFYDQSAPGWGNNHTPNVAIMERLEFGNFETTHRASIRLLYGYGEGHVDEWIIDGGVSENILSSNYISMQDITLINGSCFRGTN
jgi:acyl-homoserine lactone acylase PvdQ